MKQEQIRGVGGGVLGWLAHINVQVYKAKYIHQFKTVESTNTQDTKHAIF